MATVLIVDDLPVNRELFVAILTHTGHRLVEAANGADALAAARREHPDLVITDVLMPAMDGYELVRELRTDPSLADTPVIFCTAYYREQEARQLAVSCGVTEVLVKPCDPQDVLTAVSRVLGASATVGADPLSDAFDREHLKLVTNKLSATIDDLRATNRRLESLNEIGLQLATEHNPITLLERCCTAARSLFDAPYAVLTVWDEKLDDGFALSVEGWPDDVTEAVGRELAANPPFHDRETSFRASNPAGHPVVLGLPVAHPSIEELVAAPIASPSRRYGWLYVARAGGPGHDADDGRGFTEADERLLRMLAGIVGRVYENGRLLYEAERHAAQLAGEVAERKRAEEALRKADANMRFALEAGSVGIWEIDAESGMLTASGTFERIHGGAPEEFNRRKDAWLQRVHEQDRPAVTAAMAALTRAEGIDSEIEYRIPWLDGSEHRIVMNGRVLRNAAGAATGIGGVAIDVTEPRQLQAQLVQSQKLEAIGLLAGGVAHDFNNILTAILGYVELLESHLESDHDALKDLDEIRKSGMRAADLTRQLLAFSRRQVLRPALIDLNALIQELANMLRRLIGEDVTLTMTLEKELSSVMADRGQIEQVIMNLVVNARDAMPRGGRLTIATGNATLDTAFFRRLGVAASPAIRHMVKISVRDTGVGMDAMTRKRIFEPFFTTKGRGRGTGLGLATVYGIVKQSGGFIDVESTPGKGTQFDILLPKADRTATVATVARTEIAPTPRGTETILVVEDDDTVRSLVSSLLDRHGYKLLVFPDGESAAVFADGNSDRHIDLLLSDVVLPGMSGPELYGQLRVRRPLLRVLFMSGYNDERIVATGALAPDVHSIEKPFTSGGLARKVREVLDIEPRSAR